MLSDEILRALIEGIIYVAPEPVTLDSIAKVLEGEERERIKARLEEVVAEYEQNAHGIQIRQVANGYKFSTKAEHHEILRKYAKSLKAPVRLSKPALETLAVIAYRQPVTVPEIEEIRGVDSGGVIHTLLEKKLVVTSGRKSVVGRPILYRTSKDFLVHFGLKDVGELPSLKEFEELAKRALGSQWAAEDAPATSGKPVPASTEATPRPDALPSVPPSAAPALATLDGTSEAPPETSPAVDIETATEATQAAAEAAPVPAEAGPSNDVSTKPAPEPVHPEGGDPGLVNAGEDTLATGPEVDQPGAAEPLLTETPPAPASDALGSALPEPSPEPPVAADSVAENNSTAISEDPESRS